MTFFIYIISLIMNKVAAYRVIHYEKMPEGKLLVAPGTTEKSF